MVVGMVGADDIRHTLMSCSVRWLIVVVGSMATGGGLAFGDVFCVGDCGGVRQPRAIRSEDNLATVVPLLFSWSVRDETGGLSFDGERDADPARGIKNRVSRVGVKLSRHVVDDETIMTQLVGSEQGASFISVPEI
jgi:hypothetical protein